ncbi:MAG TPA: O-antigen ligase family protein [Polyangiaceae bacterium]|jgi:hypothetical protein|nr:O-antigen ligase family protein [Polyangiaceae bacterium]
MPYDVALVFLGAFVVASVLYGATTTRPERTLYACLIVWAFVPKALRIIYLAPRAQDWPIGVSIFTVLQAATFAGVLAALVRNRPRSAPNVRSFYALAYAYGATAVLSIVVPIIMCEHDRSLDLTRLWDLIDATVEPQERWLEAANLLYGGIFALGVVRFLRRQDQVNVVFAIFVLSGIELSLEWLLLFRIGLVSAVSQWVSVQGRFYSLTHNSYDVVPMVEILSIAGALYFAMSTKKKAYLFLVPLMMPPIFSSYERGSILAFTVCIVSAIWMWGKGYRTLAVAGVGLLYAVFLVVVNESSRTNITNMFVDVAKNDVRDYASPDAISDRFALWLRALDAIVYMFPLGAGPAMLRYTFSHVPMTFAHLSAAEVWDRYSQLEAGDRVTNAHNAYLEYVGNYGALGLTIVFLAIYIPLRNARMWKRAASFGVMADSPATATRFAAYAALAALGTRFLTDVATPPPAILLMLIYLTFPNNEIYVRAEPAEATGPGDNQEASSLPGGLCAT